MTYLLTNYRNNPNIIRAGNKVLRMIKDQAKQDMPIQPNRVSGEKIYISTYDEKYTNLVNEVARLLKIQKPEEICILTQKGAERDFIAQSLKVANIPVAKQQIRIDNDDDYKLMRAVLNILNSNNIVASTKEIQRISGLSDVTERHIQKVVLGECPVPECERELCPIKELSDELRLSSISDLSEAVYRYSIKAAELFLNIINNRDSAPGFQAFEDFCKNNIAQWPAPRHQLKELFKIFEDDTRKENQKDGPLAGGVKVSTIHAAKGLEYTVVMITGLSLGNYPSTDLIDKTFSIRKGQLQTLRDSREHYYQMRKEISPETVDNLLKTCINPAFFQTEKERLSAFQEEMAEPRNKLSTLAADGIAEYMEAYNYYVQPLEHQCAENINEQTRLLLIEQTNAGNLADELSYLQSENREAAEIRREELKQIQEKIGGIKKRIEKLKGRELRFQNTISSLKAFYNICFNASGFLAEMSKEGEMEVLYAKLEEEREQQINEERRLYYVAITRAKDYLYLCHAAGTAPSEFIRMIDDELKTEHVMLTLEEEQECRRLSIALHEETARPKSVDDQKAGEYAQGLMAVDKFQAHIQENLQTYGTLHPSFQSLPVEAKAYYDRAVGLISIAELTGENFKTEFAHNVQRMCEVVLSQYAGANAQPFITIDSTLAERISNDIRSIARNCATAKLSPKYIMNLLTQPDRYLSTFQTLKSAGILHYVVRSGRYPIDPESLSTWRNIAPLEDAGAFLIAALDLANTRNSLIHAEKNAWAEDAVPQILKNAERLVSACKIEPRPLTAKDVRIGRQVQHKTLGYGIISAVEPDRYRVDFEASGEKLFQMPVKESNAFFAL